MNETDKEALRFAKLAQENELRRSYGLPTQDYLVEEIEELRKVGKWDERKNKPI